MNGSQDLQIAGIENCTYSRICKERWEHLLGYEPPPISLDSMSEKTGSGCSPRKLSRLDAGIDGLCVCLQPNQV
jgi:hypothetical protein